MFIRNYKVKGEDVNDFMVMQNFAYLSYSSKLIEVYLFEKGFPRLKLNSLKIGWQKSNDQLINHKHLMFTEPFSAHLHFDRMLESEEKIKVYIDFYSKDQELCATLETELHWFDYNTWKFITPPKNLAQHFLKQDQLRRAV
ncbi:thioesterase family protein [Pseudotenacibaculum haliotis]|uniref:Thioesterase family protein n=1 Tax=Pseudotenacibaculum haliotis TaxID=1862138 RepID=A0ABW5LML7_9FLAO